MLHSEGVCWLVRSDIPLSGCQSLGALPSPIQLLRGKLAVRSQLFHDSSIEAVLQKNDAVNRGAPLRWAFLLSVVSHRSTGSHLRKTPPLTFPKRGAAATNIRMLLRLVTSYHLTLFICKLDIPSGHRVVIL
jgi:hypothetical protein